MPSPRPVGPAVLALALGMAAAPALAQLFTATRVLSGLSRPVVVAAPPDGTDRLFVVEQRSGSTGRIRVVDASGTLLPTPFATVTVSTASEQGLLGLAFHPDYATNGRLYINYTRTGGDSVIAELTADATDANIAAAGSLSTVLIVDQPASNHNGGWMQFGPDGYLYYTLGDGGSGDDPWGMFGNGQNLGAQLGKILRIDVDGDDFPADPDHNYAIPADNPFVGDPGVAEEIWAWGLRNPWRNDFDPQTGDLYIADVGQDAREEVNFQPASSNGGENYGWRVWEGTVLNFAGDPDPGPVVFPVTQYVHGSPDFGCSITGGVVARTCTLADLWGEFLFADFCSNRIYALRNTVGGWVRENITADITPDVGSLSNITSFGRDAQGRVYVCTLGGSVYRLGSARAGLGDINADGILNLDDLDAFIAAFQSQDPVADLDQNGIWSLDDLDLFISAFAAGCP